MNTRQKILKIFRALMFSLRLNFTVYVHCTAQARILECNVYILLHKNCTFLYIVFNNKSLKCQYTYTHKLDHCYFVLERWMYSLSCLLLFAWLCFFNLHICILLQIVKIFPLLCFFCRIVFWNNNTWLITMIVRTWTHHEICYN